MTSTAKLRFAIALLMASATFLVWATTAEAAELDRTAWWSKYNQNGVDVSGVAVGSHPEGSLVVASDPDGASAIAALHFDLDADETSPVLTLEVDESSSNSDDPSIVLLACQTGAGWSAGTAMDWGSKPPAVCDAGAGGGSVAGQQSDDGSAWIFPLATLQLATVVDVVIVPAVAADSPLPPTFQINFRAPSQGSLAVRAGAPPPPPTVVSSTTTIAVSSGSPTPPPTASTFSPRPASSPPLSRPSAQTFTPALPEQDQQLTATAPVFQAASPASVVTPVVDAVTKTWVRWLAAIQSAGAVGLVWFLLRHRDDEDESETVVTRGLGPFIRPRFGEVPSL